MHPNNIIFVTGTDTGVGKTILTALLLDHLRTSGVHALAMKPFCSGGLDDVRLLQSLQLGELSDEEVNPFYFAKPLAPLVAGGRGQVRLGVAVQKINALAKNCDCLLVEGSGGLLVPLGPGYTVADLITRLKCSVVIAARNRLGTINHTLLTVEALRSRGITTKKMAVMLIETGKRDLSSRTNHKTLRRLLAPLPVLSIPEIGKPGIGKGAIERARPKVRSELSALAGRFGFPVGKE